MKLPLDIGILGGGQLARMLALSAYSLGVQPWILGSSKQECAADVVGNHFVIGNSKKDINKFSQGVKALGIENEFVELEKLKGVSNLFPSVKSLAHVQNKLSQKHFLEKYSIPTLDYADFNQFHDVEAFIRRQKGNFVIKKATLGYDGRGTFISRAKKRLRIDSFDRHFKGYVESLADFKKELAVVAVRSQKGEFRAYPLIETFQSEGMCQWAVAPARVPKSIQKKAVSICRRIMEKLDAVGVFAVEMFWLKDGRLVVNEIAPRVHNSGHLTLNGFQCSQFENHVRALMGLPLGSTRMTAPSVAMVNIIGDRKKMSPRLTKAEVSENCWIHWYSKEGNAFKRKLGHVNAVANTPAQALKSARRLRSMIDV